jgi:hypothetical protein
VFQGGLRWFEFKSLKQIKAGGLKNSALQGSVKMPKTVADFLGWKKRGFPKIQGKPEFFRFCTLRAFWGGIGKIWR